MQSEPFRDCEGMHFKFRHASERLSLCYTTSGNKAAMEQNGCRRCGQKSRKFRQVRLRRDVTVSCDLSIFVQNGCCAQPQKTRKLDANLGISITVAYAGHVRTLMPPSSLCTAATGCSTAVGIGRSLSMFHQIEKKNVINNVRQNKMCA